ncbi:MAG: hypothetical protein FWC89_03790 [Defluviitaleaceae bacterium]|nr:hypothetical protein [Defluviitaleaceae bacterium]
MLTLDKKSENYISILNEAAESYNCIFFEDSGEGNDLVTDTLYCENVSGWLIPFDNSNKFAEIPKESRFDSDEWDDYFVFAEWSRAGNDLVIKFVKYPQPPLFEDRKQIDEIGFIKSHVFNQTTNSITKDKTFNQALKPTGT